MPDDEHPRPGSYASLERRVEAVEQSLAGVRTDVAVVQRDMAHQAELAVSHYRTVEAQNGEIKATVAALQNFIEKAIRDPASVMPEQVRIRDQWEKWRTEVDEKLQHASAIEDRWGGAKMVGVYIIVVISALASIAGIIFDVSRIASGH